MKVLLIHDFYQIFGGEDAVALSERKLLEKHGHQVLLYSRHNDELQSFGVPDKLYFIFDTVYSMRTAREVKKTVLDFQPDVAYIHNIYPLISPSVYHLLYSMDVPIVQCVHNFRPFCPNGLFFTHGERCQRCKGGNYLHSIVHHCYRDSYYLSLVYAASVAVNRLKNMLDRISAFICLTKFYEKLLVEQGVPEEKIFVRPSSIDTSVVTPHFGAALDPYAVYLGRLSVEKGPWTLLRAFEYAPEVRLKIIGTGPLEEDMRRYIQEKGLHNVEMVGFKTGEEKWELLKNALFAVISSDCYENFPVAALEFYAAGKPIVAPDLGGLPYIIKDAQTGLLFRPDNSADLADKARHLFSHPEEAVRMGRRARELAEIEFSPDKSYENLMNIFEQVRQPVRVLPTVAVSDNYLSTR
jgi:glycosyltransferase involved in cell wall biosynthesis